MRRAALFLIPLFLFGCDREPVAPDVGLTPTLGATQEWVPWTIDVEFTAYFDCIDETLLITGQVQGMDHYITPPSHERTRTHNVEALWPSQRWVGTATGHVWLPLPGYTGRGVLVNEGSEFVAFFENLRFQNQTTGVVLHNQFWWHFVKNAQGEIVVDRMELRCTRWPKP